MKRKWKPPPLIDQLKLDKLAFTIWPKRCDSAIGYLVVMKEMG